MCARAFLCVPLCACVFLYVRADDGNEEGNKKELLWSFNKKKLINHVNDDGKKEEVEG